MNNEYEEEEYELSGGIEIGWKKNPDGNWDIFTVTFEFLAAN